MIICCDFDGVIVSDRRSYGDVVTPLQFTPGAKEGLLALKRAGHVLILWSARANREPRRERAEQIHQARLKQMLDFVRAELPEVFDEIDAGNCGKIEADLYLDDKCQRVGRGAGAMDWAQLAYSYGEFDYGTRREAQG